MPVTLKDELKYAKQKSLGEEEVVRRDVEAEGQTCKGRAHLELQRGCNLAGYTVWRSRNETSEAN